MPLGLANGGTDQLDVSGSGDQIRAESPPPVCDKGETCQQTIDPGSPFILLEISGKYSKQYEKYYKDRGAAEFILGRYSEELKHY